MPFLVDQPDVSELLTNYTDFFIAVAREELLPNSITSSSIIMTATTMSDIQTTSGSLPTSTQPGSSGPSSATTIGIVVAVIAAVLIVLLVVTVILVVILCRLESIIYGSMMDT